MESKISEGVRMLEEQGHLVEGRVHFHTMWWEIDRQILATPEEMTHLADAVYSFSELEELHKRGQTAK
jgi:hypothetical protein